MSPTSYEFDSAGQLKRENNQAAGKTWVYTYDKGGNIVSKKEYAYTTGTLGTPTSTKDYTYDSVWGDLLIGYNGVTVTSDDIGNTLYDGLRTFTWEHGRQLATLRVAQDAAWSFTYDTGGMRTHRTDGTNHYSYVYNGGQLTQVRRGNDTVDIAYADGKPMSLTLNNDAGYYSL